MRARRKWGENMAEDTVKRNKRQAEWRKANKDRLELVLPKGYKQKIKDVAELNNMSVTEWIVKQVDKSL